MKFTIHKNNNYWRNTGDYRRHLDSLADGSYEIEIKAKNKRSLPQNAYYHSVVVDMVYHGLRDAGFNIRNKEDAHEILKALFLKTKEEKNGVVIERVKSTTELNKQEFGEYLDNINVWAFDYLNITIPLPNQQLEII